MGLGHWLRGMMALAVGAAAIAAVSSIARSAILGHDDREIDDGQHRWTEAIGYVTPAPGSDVAGTLGTAFLVRPQVILTNWHNLYADDGTLQARNWVYMRDVADASPIPIVAMYNLTLMSARDIPLKQRSRSRDVIALVLAEPAAMSPLMLAPVTESEMPERRAYGAEKYAMSGFSVSYAFDKISPRTVQRSCGFASLATNEQFPDTPGLIGHTCDVWPGNSGAPLVEAVEDQIVVRAINVAQVLPERKRENYERRMRDGDIIAPDLANHINIAIPITQEITDLVAAAEAYAARRHNSADSVIAEAGPTRLLTLSEQMPGAVSDGHQFPPEPATR